MGLGAIGSGTALILSELPVEGRLDLVDPQRFSPENLGTYSLGDAASIREAQFKTQLARAALHRFETRGWQVPVADIPSLIDSAQIGWPSFVLAGLDSAEARRDTQRIWPDLLIDGATGDTMVGLHVVRDAGRPCLACLFPPPAAPAGAAVAALAAATGLPAPLVVRGAERLRAEHLAGLDASQRARLEPFVGREICGLATALGLADLPDEGYRPAVPFVSLTAATLVVGRLIAHATGSAAKGNFVQFDALAGPRRMTSEERNPRLGCYCSERETVIAEVRSQRRLRVPPPPYSRGGGPQPET